MMRPLLIALATAGVLLGSAGARAQDEAAELIVRLNRLEGVVRQLSGQVEQLGFENRQLKEQARRFQEDVEFRFGERGAGRSAPPAASSGAAPAPAARPARRSDAYDPESEPAAPGAPRPLGTTPPTRTGEAGGARNGIASLIEADKPARAGGAPAVNPAEVNGLNPGFGGGPAGARVPSVAATSDGGARGDYDAAAAALAGRRFDEAEMGFRRFIQSHPRDRLVADATYGLGESYLARNRPREAAEQFLKVSTDFTRSAKAPEALLKLGTSLAALGAKEQACATFAELERKYPNAAAGVKQGVDREQKRVRCTG